MVIQIENLTQRFQIENKPVLKGIDLSIEPGQLALVAGPSGCGKSTLAYCIKGIIPHQVDSIVAGAIQVDGLDTQQNPPATLATKVGMVFQDPEAQLCNLYFEDEVAFGPENLKLDPEIVNARVEEALNRVGLGGGEFRNKFVYEISGGQKQRLAIASVLAMDPRVLIFDEPTANLDPQGGREVFQTIRRLHAEGYTIVVIEHKLEELIDVADRLIVISDGQIALDGPPRLLLEKHGRALKEEYGLWVPEISQIAIELQNEFHWNPFPLSVSELEEQMRDQISNVSDATDYTNSLNNDRVGYLANTEEMISVDELHYCYPDGTVALDGVSFNLKCGETVGIAGTNGSGKTTLAKILVGLLKPTAGTATVCGINVARTSTYNITQKVGYVFQYPEHQFLKERVYDEVAYSLEVHNYDEESIRLKTLDVLRQFGLQDFQERHPLALSGGQKRRLSVATALVLEPELLILDEPTFGQDQDNTRRMMEYLLQQISKRRDMTTVMITHDMELLALYCNRALIMSEGKIIYNGPPRSLFGCSEVLTKGSLKNLSVYELISRLNANNCRVPELITVREFVDWYHRIAEPPIYPAAPAATAS
jgi:energy-coupling factor transporter ATP-binding protein EcfA2